MYKVKHTAATLHVFMHLEFLILKCRVHDGGVDMDDRLECRFNNYNDSGLLEEEDIANLRLALAENQIPLTTVVVVAGLSLCCA